MKIGFGAPVSGSWATPSNLAQIAHRADQLGYHSLWTFQRILSPVNASMGEPYRAVHDPILPLAYAAAVTSRIRLSIAVVNMPFVPPVVLAKQLTTLDILSGGRVDAGLGNGWSDPEFTATGATKRNQGRRAEEFIAVLKRAWTDEVVAYEGSFYHVPPTRMDPKPVQRPHPPILLGGSVEPALRRAGRLCDGWVSSSRTDPRRLGETVAVIKAAAERAGQDPAALRLICRAAVRVRPAGSPERGPWTGTVDQIRADFDEVAGQGITELFVDLNFDPQIGSPDADPTSSMRRADEALEAFAPR
jgi:probable F420-dependent oxidoreductase